MFARGRLTPGSPDYELYYAMRPEKKNGDDQTRALPGLLSDEAQLFEPLSFAAAKASFDLTEAMREHVDGVLAIPGSALLFGGAPLQGHSIPSCYGAYEPTAVQVPLQALGGEHFERVTTELFGPFQVIVRYGDGDLSVVLETLERISHHLTAAVVSADPEFQEQVLGATVNGTTYCGLRARTTAAPQNHWFGPCGDPRAAGIGTPEAIIATWSGHREIIMDQGSLEANWVLPPSL